MSPSLGVNVLAMLAARFLPAVFGFGIHVAVARLAGPATLGAYVNLLAVLLIFQAITGAGMQFYVSREVAAFPTRALELARQARAFGLMSGLAGTAAYVLYALTILPGQRLLPALVLAATVLPSAWIAVQEALFVGTRTHHWIAVVAVVENALKVALASLALVSGMGLLGVCISIACSRLAALGIGAWLVRRAGLSGTWRIQIDGVVSFARVLAPFSALFVVSMVYFRIDVPIVQAVAGEGQTGLYGAAVTLYGALLLVPESALSAAYPRLAAAFHASREGYARATWLMTKVLTVLLVPVSLALIALSDTIVALVYGPAFAGVAPVLRLLALALPLHAFNGALGQALQGGGEQRAMVSVVSVGLVVHVVLTVLLVSALGVNGAAISMIVSSSCVALGALRALHTRVAAVRLTTRDIPAVLAVVGPLVLASVAPPGLRMAAAAAGMAWLAAGALWHGIFVAADVDGMRAAFSQSGSGATA